MLIIEWRPCLRSARTAAAEARALRDLADQHPRGRHRGRARASAAFPDLRGDRLHCLRARQTTHRQGSCRLVPTYLILVFV